MESFPNEQNDSYFVTETSPNAAFDIESRCFGLYKHWCYCFENIPFVRADQTTNINLNAKSPN